MGFQLGALGLPWCQVPHLDCVFVSPLGLMRISVALVFLLAWGKVPPLAVVSLAFLMAMSAAGILAQDLKKAAFHPAPNSWSFLERPFWRGRLMVRTTGWPVPIAGNKWRFPANVLVAGKGKGQGGIHAPNSGAGVLLTSDSAPQPGEILALQLRLGPPGRAAMPGGFDDRVYLLSHGLSWRGYVKEQFTVAAPADAFEQLSKPLVGFHQLLLTNLNRLYPRPEAEIISAVLMGTKTPLTRAAAKPFATLGLAHLFALSGLHVGILLGILLLPSRALALGSGARFFVVVLILPSYIFLAGGSGSVVRASAMALVVLGGPWLGRKGDPLRQLGLIYLMVSGWSPWSLLDVGVQLSFLATGGILGIGQLTSGFKVSGPAPIRALATGLGVSIAAQWFTLPVVAGSFGYINPWSSVANIVFVPLFGLTVWFSVLGLLAVGWSALANALAGLAVFGWRLMLWLVRPAADLGQKFIWGMAPPGIEFWLIWFVLTCCLLWLLRIKAEGSWPRRIWLSGMVAVILVAGTVFPSLSHNLRPKQAPVAWQVDVGQGDCACLVFPDGWVCIIDNGGRYGKGGPGSALWKRSLGPFLARQGQRRIDLAILTHGHMDHTGGSSAMCKSLVVKAWLCGGKASKPDEAPRTSLELEPKRGMLLHKWGNWSLVLLQAPDPRDNSLSENNHSLLVALKLQNQIMMLWGGDQEEAAEKLFRGDYPDFPPVQVWKAGHHGSNTSGTLAFLEMIHPRLCVVSCGRGNKYHHPSHGPYVIGTDTLPEIRTDESGSILFSWNENGELDWQTLYGSGGRIEPLDRTKPSF